MELMEVIMKKSTVLLFISLIGLSALMGVFGAISLYEEYTVYAAGVSQIPRNGSEPVKTPELYELIHKALEAMGVKRRNFITIFETSRTSGSGTWHMWLSMTPSIGPWKYIVFHEAAHVALNHYALRVTKKITTNEESKAQEIDADLLACKTLFE